MAQQIIDLDNRGKIAPDETTLRRILLQPEVKDKKVCVVSITGTFRQGKSFLLNFFIRYLTLKYKMKKPVSDKWLDFEDGNISGFAWKCGSDRHTVGILMWSEIFLAELPSGEEVAIVLLDTQGTFDNESSKQQCAGIFAISTLISSVQIYNLKDKINQFDLEHLECFSGYGQLALESNGSPFQNLCFLIRDWQYSFQKSFGASGGQELLDEVSSPDQPLELKRQCENIRNLFEKITCFLLPFPGDKVAKDPSFLGDLAELDPDFLKHVEEFVPTILAKENLVPKVINGETITVSDLFHFIQNYCQYFSNHEVPLLKSMFMVTAETHLKIASEESEATYQNSMDFLLDASKAVDPCCLLEKHEIEKTRAVARFERKKAFGNEELKECHRRILEQKLNEKFLVYNQLNAGRLEKSLALAEQKKRHEAEGLAQRKQLESQFREDYNEKRLMLESRIESTQDELQRCRRGERSSALRPGLRSRIAALEKPVERKNFLRKFCDFMGNSVVEGIAMVRGSVENHNRSGLRPEDN